MTLRSRLKPLTLPIDLSDPEHIQCPHHLYRRLHDAGAVGLDPDIGVAVVGYRALVALSKDTGLFSSSITQDGQGPRHMGFGHGPHFCAGAELARLEAKIAFELLLTKLEEPVLDAEASDLARHPSFASTGHKRIVVSFGG